MTETLDRPIESPADLDILPAAGRIGAEIRGIDISKPVAPETVEAIRRALDTWKVVFFRDQDLDHAVTDFLRPPVRRTHVRPSS